MCNISKLQPKTTKKHFKIYQALLKQLKKFFLARNEVMLHKIWHALCGLGCFEQKSKICVEIKADFLH